MKKLLSFILLCIVLVVLTPHKASAQENLIKTQPTQLNCRKHQYQL